MSFHTYATTCSPGNTTISRLFIASCKSRPLVGSFTRLLAHWPKTGLNLLATGIWWHQERLTDLRLPACNNPASQLISSAVCRSRKGRPGQLLDDRQCGLRSIIMSSQSHSILCHQKKLRLHSRVDSSRSSPSTSVTFESFSTRRSTGHHQTDSLPYPLFLPHCMDTVMTSEDAGETQLDHPGSGHWERSRIQMVSESLKEKRCVLPFI